MLLRNVEKKTLAKFSPGLLLLISCNVFCKMMAVLLLIPDDDDGSGWVVFAHAELKALLGLLENLPSFTTTTVENHITTKFPLERMSNFSALFAISSQLTSPMLRQPRAQRLQLLWYVKAKPCIMAKGNDTFDSI